VLGSDVAATFLRWSAARAAFHRGWLVATSLYLVVDAELSTFQLLVYGAVLAFTTVVAEIPTGVMADAVSRKWSLVIAHLAMGSGMAMLGLVTAFPLILVTQVLWALGWTFSSGADVAWVTDELDRPERIARVLTARGRWEALGGVAGIVGFGALAWGAGLAAAIVAAGSSMLVLGVVVAVWFTERNFTPRRRDRWRESRAILGRGVVLARRDRQILVILAATLLLNLGGEPFDFLSRKQFVELGFPAGAEPIVWLTALGIASLGGAALALRIVEGWIDGIGAAPRIYAGATFAGAAGVLLLALAPNGAVGMVGALVVQAVAWPVTRSVGIVWVNRRTTSDVRATVHSFLSQAESFGEALGGAGFGLLALSLGIGSVLTLAAVVLAVAAVLVVASRAGRESGVEALAG
jgi:hypothetical protein